MRIHVYIYMCMCICVLVREKEGGQAVCMYICVSRYANQTVRYVPYLLCSIALSTTEGVFLSISRSFNILKDSANSTFLNQRSLNGICPLLFDVKTDLNCTIF